jgi:hypothetical protein
MMHQRKLFKALPQLEFNEERRVLLSSQAESVRMLSKESPVTMRIFKSLSGVDHPG